MPNGNSNETAAQPAPGISADFLTGNTETGLDRIRTRLLDLTNRNKLLNYRHTTASSLRVVDVPIDAVYTEHLSAVLAASESVDQHPWAWIGRPLSFAEEDRVLDALSQFVATVRQAHAYCDHLLTTAGITLARTCRGLEHADQTLTLLPQSAGALIDDLMTPCQSADSREVLSKFIGHVEAFRSGLATVSASAGNASSLLDAHTADELSEAIECLSRWSLDAH